MTALYNEIDPYAADWLENLIAAGLIAPGIVDRRDIRDLTPDYCSQFTQCHFFAGIGVWSYALRRAGWPDDRPVWTGSCPCQPFSAAGRAGGFADERHLWPHWHHLIRECRPPEVFGEQVASKDGLGWLDLVQADMEATGYAFGPFDLCAAGFGAPHIRQRLFFVGTDGLQHAAHDGRQQWGTQSSWGSVASGRSGVRLADSNGVLHYGAGIGRSRRRFEGSNRRTALGLDHHHHQGPQGHAGDGDGVGGWEDAPGSASEAGIPGGLADSDRGSVPLAGRGSQVGNGQRPDRAHHLRGTGRPGPTNGFWDDPDWLFCRDGKWRPVESGTFPLAHGVTARVGRLRAYGNAIVAEVAEAFIGTFLEHEADAAQGGDSSVIEAEYDVVDLLS